jgi:hypothetical protein
VIKLYLSVTLNHYVERMWHESRASLIAAVLVVAAFPWLARYLVRLLKSQREGMGRTIVLWMIASFFLHLLVGTAGSLTHLRHYVAPDAGIYQSQALAIQRHWASGAPLSPATFPGKEGFPYMLAGLYTVLGNGPILGIVVNAVLVAALIPLVADTGARLFPESDARYLCPILVLLPSLVVWPSQLMREAGAIFLIALIVNASLRLNARPSIWAGAVIAVSSALLLTFRAPVAIVVLACVVLASIFVERPLSRMILPYSFVVAGTLILVLGVGIGYSGLRDSLGLGLPRLDKYRETVTGDSVNTSISSGAIDTPGGALAALPLSIARFSLGPFPWELGSKRELPAVAETIGWLALLPALFYGLRHSWDLRSRRAVPSLVAALLLVPALALIAGNYGLMLRERMQVTVL